MGTPRTPKGKPVPAASVREAEQRRELERLHAKLAAQGIDERERKRLFRATEVRGGAEGLYARLLSAAKTRAAELSSLFERRRDEHEHLHVLLGAEPCESLSKCRQDDDPLGHDAAVVLGLNMLIVGAEGDLSNLRRRMPKILGQPGRDSRKAVVTFLADKTRAGDLACSFREIAFLRLEARGRTLPFSDTSIKSETGAVKKAASEYRSPPRDRRKRVGPNKAV